MSNYVERLCVPIQGDVEREFYTCSGVHIATGYDRVVIGGRGPYVEFDISHLVSAAFKDACASHYYYHELRSEVDNVKVYVQIQTVDYADYVPGKCYISPFELYDASGKVLIEAFKHS